jgi:hypothetical protein
VPCRIFIKKSGKVRELYEKSLMRLAIFCKKVRNSW